MCSYPRPPPPPPSRSGLSASTPLPLSPRAHLPLSRNTLLYPGKVSGYPPTAGDMPALFGGGSGLIISDTAHHRVLVADTHGNVQVTLRGNVQVTLRGNVQVTLRGNVQVTLCDNVQVTLRGNVQVTLCGN